MMSLQILVVLCCALTALALPPSSPIQNDGEALEAQIRNLPWQQRLAILAASKMRQNPNSPKGFPLKSVLMEGLFEGDHPWLDVSFLDMHSLLVQLKKVSRDASLPEMDYYYFVDGGDCSGFFCFHLDINMDTGNTVIKGQEDFEFKTEFTPTSFKTSYKIPSFKWSSPGFKLNITDLDFGDSFVGLDLQLDVLDMETTFSADFRQVENRGLMLSNFTIDFSVALFETRLEDMRGYSSSGEFEKYGPSYADMTEDMNRRWVDYRDVYALDLQSRINCVLTNKASNPVKCPADEETERYYRMNVAQVFETMGLASMSRP